MQEFVHVVIQYTAEQRSRSCNFPPSSNSFRRFRSLRAGRQRSKRATKQPPDLISHCSCCRYSIWFLNIWQVAYKFQWAATPWHSRGSCRPNCAAPTTSTARYLLAMDVNCRQSTSNMSYFLLLHCTSIFIELEKGKVGAFVATFHRKRRRRDWTPSWSWDNDRCDMKRKSPKKSLLYRLQYIFFSSSYIVAKIFWTVTKYKLLYKKFVL